MTSVLTRPELHRDRVPTRRHYVMCPPAHFAVEYAINPWMDPAVPVDRDLAHRQWDALRRTHLELGHQVTVVEAVPGLPDMVFAANAATSVAGRVYGARFRYPERVPEAAAFRAHLPGVYVEPRFVNEGEGDLLVAGDVLLAGTGFRTDPRAHREAARVLRRPTLSLELVDPRFYHLDTALAVLSAHEVTYLPSAFSARSRGILAGRYPDAVLATESDAAVLGLNAVSDGRHVVLPAAATGLAADLRERGFEPIGVDLSELLKGGGGPKCCTLEVRP
ncbi:dimethylargininase [Pseudonocardia oroxyli]|uniref:N-Dimethylarginine dimethylaminohydrolase n=1 Tax=Pseudonocardia oroxyli TaxID=366584 RepID=A0A1G7IDP8_PSEOR|nr:dimethylargininase [Pseudonocardia oroxyli]SDF10847.1 N-Dimethylarginine dimethylaminohydrolase [Pseudonocardia oroxyli]